VRTVDAGVGVGWHVIDDHLALLGAQREGFALRRFLDLLGINASSLSGLDERAATNVEAPAGGLRVLDAEGDSATLTGIGRTPSPEQVWRAAVEAVVERGAQLFDVVAGFGTVERIVVAGGWAHSPTLRAVKRRRLPVPLDVPAVVEAGARGAALLAGCAAGIFSNANAVPRPHTATLEQLAAAGRDMHG
jgi:sugar (pentulose or hexulose) kinase